MSTEAQALFTPPTERLKASNGSVSNWKKRARQGAASTQLKDQKGASDDGLKEDQRELEAADYQSKKGRKSMEAQHCYILESAVAVEQLRQAQ